MCVWNLQGKSGAGDERAVARSGEAGRRWRGYGLVMGRATAPPRPSTLTSQSVSAPGLSFAGLFGTVGGNLGMFTGMSIMTIVEWLEVLFPRPSEFTLPFPSPPVLFVISF